MAGGRRSLFLARRPRLPQRHPFARRAALMLGLGASLAGAAPPNTARAEVVFKVTEATFAEPTLRYGHGVLGDNVEYGALILQRETIDVNGLKQDADLRRDQIKIRLPVTRVFEDLAPRLVDLNQDGSAEVMVVESDAQRGAQLAIYDATGRKIAATPHIGTRFRWLAPIGAADLDGDGAMEIAYIDRPHLAKTLRIWRYTGGQLTEAASAKGLTNHRIGEDFITSGLRDCGKGPEIVTVDANWSWIMLSRLVGDQIKTHKAVRFSRKHGLTAVLDCRS